MTRLLLLLLLAACSDDEETCAPGEVVNTFQCNRRCDQPGERGDACASGQDDDGCSGGERPCADALVCVKDRSVVDFVSFCVPPAGREFGEPCDEDDECSDGLLCDVDDRRLCLGAGDFTCGENADCASHSCVESACTAREPPA